MRLLVVNIPSQTEEGYDRGEIVSVRRDDRAWGRQEDPATRTRTPRDKFCRIVVPDAPYEYGHPRFEAMIRLMSEEEFDPRQVGVLTNQAAFGRKSRGRLDLGRLSDSFDLSKEVEIPWGVFVSHLMRGGDLAREVAGGN